LLYYVAKTALLNDDNTKKGLWVRSLLLGAHAPLAPQGAQIDHHGVILASLSIIYPAKCFINKIRHPIILSLTRCAEDVSAGRAISYRVPGNRITRSLYGEIKIIPNLHKQGAEQRETP